MMRIRGSFAILAAALAVAGLPGCGDSKPVVEKVDSGWTVTKTATIEGLQHPECVVVDPPTGVAYISNMVAPKETFWVEDGTGFITKLKPGGEVDVLKWKDSTKEEPINSPKGMCIVKNVLHVADIKRVLRFQTSDGQALPPVTIKGAQRLNDMAFDGAFAYVSDTATGKIWKLEGDKPVELKSPPGVNGITFNSGRMFAVSWTTHELYELDPAGKNDPRRLKVASYFDSLDAVEVLQDGSFLLSDFGGGKVCVVSPKAKTVRTIAVGTTPADIGIDFLRDLLYVPEMTANKVTVYKLTKK